MLTEDKSEINEAWKISRSGAWAGRGFHFQHFFSTLILIRQWAGLVPAGNLVPEGLEDCVLELADREFWLQVKSRKKGMFDTTYVKKTLEGVESKNKAVSGKANRKSIVILEQQCKGFKEIDLADLFEEVREQVFVCSSPRDECIAILTSQLDTSEIIVEGIVSDLYELVASASENNAYLPFDKRRRISTTEIEYRIFERMEAEDPSAIDFALSSGALVPVSFNPVIEPAFYQGVKVTPGHVAAELVFDRKIDRENINDILAQKRKVLISGQSGAGKSALLWSAVHRLSGDIRWFQITAQAIATEAEVIIRFLRARRPTEKSPIGLAFDEVGTTSAALWNVLASEVGRIPCIYLLGSIRQEDKFLISNQSDIEFFQVSLDENLAEMVWEKLHAEAQTNWEHWREPLELSEGLMLEFVHILTQGKRLSLVIEDQIRLRQEEDREVELAIIRCTAVLCASGGDVKIKELTSILNINPAEASLAMKRLLDEHLVKESSPGILGGLHMLRSEALLQASHDQLIYLPDDSFWSGLLAVTSDTLPKVIQSIFSNVSDDDEESSLYQLAEVLNRSQDINTWISILTGLGLATLERNVVSFMGILEQYEVKRGHWTLASMFGDSKVKIPDLKGFEQWKGLQEAVLFFRSYPKQDLRQNCLNKLPKEFAVPVYKTLRQANQLLSCIAPICGGEPVNIDISARFIGSEVQNIQEVAELLSSAYQVNPDIAKGLVNELGGEEVLFDWYLTQTPWVTPPKIDLKGMHGRTVRSDLFYVSELEQKDPHDDVCDICKTLIAISPDSAAAASDAVTPLEKPFVIGDYQPWSKNIPRENLPADIRISWNVAFRQIMLSKSVSDSLTEYTKLMAALIRRTEKLFRSYSEKWVRGKGSSKVETLIVDINDIVSSVNALAYTAPDKISHEMTTPSTNTTKEDSLGALLTGILGNLLERMSGDNPKATATFSGSLANQAREYETSLIWRTNSNPPSNELKALSERLMNISYILHELAYDDTQLKRQSMNKSTKLSSPGKAIFSVARRYQYDADRRLEVKLKSLEDALTKEGWTAKCWLRPIEEADSVYWPKKEVAIVVYIEDLETEGLYSEAVLRLGCLHLGTSWRFRVVPVINGFVVTPLAILPSTLLQALPDNSFAMDWDNYIDLPFFASKLLKHFDAALKACTQTSAILACRNLESLHPEEEAVFSKSIEEFEKNRNILFEAAESFGLEYLALAYEYLCQTWNQISTEFEGMMVGEAEDEPLCMSHYNALSGLENEQLNELVVIRILFIEGECFRANTTPKIN